MKIVQMFGPTYRDDGFPFYIRKFLNKISGVSCQIMSMRVPLSEWPPYDWAHYIDWGQDNFPDVPTYRFPPKTLVWVTDTHWTEQAYRNRLAWAQMGEIALVCHHSALEPLKRDGIANPIWMPAAADHTVYTPLLRTYEVDISSIPPDPALFKNLRIGSIPKYDVCFVGHTGDAGRQEALEEVFHAFPDFYYGQDFFQEAAKVYGRTKCVFNKSVRGDLNMRTFEALASRAFLVTDRQDGMAELGLKDEKHCIIYDSIPEAISRIQYYLYREDKREAIADAGWRWCLENHTYWHRARTMLELQEAVDKKP